MNKELAKQKLKNSGFELKGESRLNDCGYKLEYANGAIVNVYDKGTFNVQGKNTEKIKEILKNIDTLKMNSSEEKTKIFVVYGHDNAAKAQLEAILRRWELEPLILDQLVSGGKMILEKLEEYMLQAQFGIVLATPDDIGYPKNSENDKKYRVRQNVVLELGMLLGLLKREKVVILLQEQENMEKPSDIQGLIYLPFKEDVNEVIIPLIKELNKHGYNISLDKL